MKIFALGALATIAMLPGAAFAEDYPAKDLQGIVQFSAGGGTDTYARSLQPYLEDELGKSIIMTNRTGANGSIGMQYVGQQAADGYTLLFASEAPSSYKVLGLADTDLTDFVPVNITNRGVTVIVVSANSELKTFQDLLDKAKAEPGQLKMGFLGAGSPGHIVGTMIGSATDFQVNAVPYEGDGAAMPALLGGHLDFMPLGLSSAQDMIKAGRMRALTVINDTAIEQLPGVPPVTDTLPELAKYLPWGTFYGVYVAKGTPQAVVDKLVAAAHSAADNTEFKKLMASRDSIEMNLAGEEAETFLAKTRSVTSWLLADADAVQKDPAEFDIPRP